MNSRQRILCEQWESAIIDGKRIDQLIDFEPDLMMTYWQSEGFRPEALLPLRRQFKAWEHWLTRSTGHS